MRILHLPTDVGGNSYGLAKAERKLGIDARVLYRNESWIQYPADIILPYSNNRAKELVILLREAVKIYSGYDVYHFNFGSTLLDFPERGLNLLELPFLKEKKIVVTYNGCDARQKYKRIEQTSICACSDALCYDGVCNNISVDKKKERRINKFQKYGAKFFALNPDLMHVLPENTVFLPYTIANWDYIETSYDPNRYNVIKKIKIVHAPSNRNAKGSEIIIKTLNRLIHKYPGRIEFELVEKVPYKRALEIYRSADLIIDQIKLGWYGAFGVEAMKMGKPIIAFINDDDIGYVPKQMADDCKNSIISADETNLGEVLEELINDFNKIKEKNEAQLEYVYKWHNPVSVASITKGIYEE